jgi:hypothetical protein
MAKSQIIVIITDAWQPQVNGVATTYKNIIKHLSAIVKSNIFLGYSSLDILQYTD